VFFTQQQYYITTQREMQEVFEKFFDFFFLLFSKCKELTSKNSLARLSQIDTLQV